ncbi:hypothetical protein HPB49_007316 [Dermacentor silvarum]|uniref:Uncharacterized protein n=1 Tax=Dermacentor silvarum TaxID=543639 RepID=A0ACB8C7Y8_DERSI|nr:hypothetical protein HPB49_007316 [Dermacentor silvarum]
MAGGNYDISIRQTYETEGRIRLQNTLPVMSSEDLKGIEDTSPVSGTNNNFCITVRDADLAALSAHMPVIAYVGGYCAHAAMKVLKCESCQESLVVDKEEAELESDPHSLIT